MTRRKHNHCLFLSHHLVGSLKGPVAPCLITINAMSLCKACISGVTHEGTPQGKWEEIGDVNSYVATPTIDYPKDKVVLFLTDVFGPQFLNNQLLADDFARNGFRTIIPDYLNSDPIPASMMNSDGTKVDINAWKANHGPDKTRPALDKVLAALKAEGVVAIGATGYCFGGRYVFDLAFENIIQVAATSHPSLLQIPADLEKYAATSRAPLLINSCTVDQQFPPEAQAKADEIFGNGKFAPGYKREYFEGCTHGFAVRGDMSDPKVKAGKEGAFKATVESGS
ncbi:putative dienelactone hydrolase family protein [Lyophyllum shimeji]|uniref:Dienelactone hydrolase family protein n=1 Tax=Lyophyllum shimeji TaxID=47721 RepID=A0A9P3USM0_LYOSH|nr:putative dienelactone hydrolase family protein [Lyophyllum shimeji]